MAATPARTTAAAATAATTTTMTLKLLVDTINQRVLVAEAGKDFVDFLFNILTLPLGSTIKLLTKPEMVGSLGCLYDSIENFNDTYMASNKKENLLNPKVVDPIAPYTPLPDITPTPPPKPKNYYRCGNTSYGTCREYITVDNPNTLCPNCQRNMNIAAKFVEPPPLEVSGSLSGEGGYVRGVAPYMVMDDLVVRPMSTISCIALLSSFNIKDVGTLEEKVITFGLAEGINLLEASLQSKTVLTDIFLRNQKVEVK